LLLVSHDGAFLNNVVEHRHIQGDGSGVCRRYDDWIRQRPKEAAGTSKKKAQLSEKALNQPPVKLTYKGEKNEALCRDRGP
jgi:ATPase subunit of ABC transporter with duplicated ATPase domains